MIVLMWAEEESISGEISNTVPLEPISTTTSKFDSLFLAALTKKQDDKKDFQDDYNPNTPRPYPLLSVDELKKMFLKPDQRSVTTKPEKSTKVADDTTQKEEKNSYPNLKEPATSSRKGEECPDNSDSTDAAVLCPGSTSLIKSDKPMDHNTQGSSPTTKEERCDEVYNLASTNTFIQTPGLQNVKKQQPLVRSDHPHAYENKTKRRQHDPKKPTDNLTSAETLQYQKERKEQLALLEQKLLRTKNLLKEKYNKSWDGKDYKVQNKPKVEKPIKTVDPTVQPKYQPVAKVVNQPATRVVKHLAARPVTKVSNVSQTSRKRPASSSVDTPSSAKRKARHQHRIILRIFCEGSDWNVEQIVDRF